MDLVGNFVKDLNIDKVRNLAEDAFNQVKPKNEVEVRVYEVLSHKNWGASSTLMNEIAQDTFDYERFLIVTKLMWEAIETPRPSAWRVIFKGLTLLEHLVKNGSERCVDDARNHSHLLRSMDRFNYYEGTVDRGQGVREKAKQITDILGDDERIREERTKARQLREKFAGRSMTNSSSGVGGGGGGGSTKYAGYGNSDAGWNSRSSGYGESGIGATSPGRDTSDRGYAGRYGEGGVDSGSSRRTSDTAPTKKSSKSGSSKVKKSKKKEKKATPAAPAPAAPEVDLFGFDDVPTNAPAQADNSFDAFQSAGAPAPVAAPPAANDDFGDFQQIAPSSAVQFDAFGSAPAPQQASFDAFGAAPSQPPAAVSNNMNTMNDAFGNMNFQSAPAPAATMPAPATSEDDDDFGDFAGAEPSAKSNVTSSDPLSKLISLDGLSKNTKKEVKKEPSFNTAAPSQYGFQQQNNSQPVLGTGQTGDIGEVFGQLMTNNQQAQAQQRMAQQRMAQQMNQQKQSNTGMNMMGGNNNMMGGMQGNQMGMQQMNPQMGGQMMGGMQGQGMGGMGMQGNTNNMQGMGMQGNTNNMQGMGMQGNTNNMQGMGMQGNTNNMQGMGMQGNMNNMQGMGGMNNNMNMNQMGGQQMGGMNGMMGGQQQFW